MKAWQQALQPVLVNVRLHAQHYEFYSVLRDIRLDLQRLQSTLLANQSRGAKPSRPARSYGAKPLTSEPSNDGTSTRIHPCSLDCDSYSALSSPESLFLSQPPLSTTHIAWAQRARPLHAGPSAVPAPVHDHRMRAGTYRPLLIVLQGTDRHHKRMLCCFQYLRQILDIESQCRMIVHSIVFSFDIVF